MNPLTHELTLAWRRLLRRRASTAVVVATLFVAITLVLLSWSLYSSIYIRAPGYDPERTLYVVQQSSRTSFGFRSLREEADAWVANQEVFSEIAITSLMRTPIVSTAEGSWRVSASVLSTDALQMVRARPSLGRLFTSEEDKRGGPRAVLLADAYWKKHYAGRTDVAGEVITIEGLPSVIVGVMPPEFQFPDTHDMWLSGNFEQRPQRWFDVIVRLRPGISHRRAELELEQIGNNVLRDSGAKRDPLRPHLIRFHDRHLPRQIRTGAFILLVLGAAFLAISCVNAANLVLADFLSRFEQVATFFAIGLPRRACIRIAVFEVGIMTVLAAAGAIVAVHWLAKPIYFRMGELGAPAWVRFGNGPELWIAAAAIAALLGATAALIPSALLLVMKPEHIMRAGRATRGSAQSAWRLGLVTLQVALLTALGCASGLLLESQKRITEIDLGFDPANMLAFNLALPSGEIRDHGLRGRLFQQATEELARLPGVERVAFSDSYPGMRSTGSFDAIYHAERSAVADQATDQTARIQSVSADFFRSLRIELLAGHDFSHEGRAAYPNEAVVNQRLADRLWPGENPVGRVFFARLRADARGVTRELVVRGVVKDYRTGLLLQRPRDIIHVLVDEPAFGYFVFVRSASRLPSAEAVQRSVHAVDRRFTVAGIGAYQQQLARHSSMLRLTIALSILFTAAAGVLGVVGIYSTTSSAIAQQRRECGIMMALGATPASIWAKLTRRYMIGAAIGVLAGLWLTHLAGPALAAILYQVGAFDYGIAATVVVVVLTAALGGCLPAFFKLRRIDPAECLRSL